MLATQISARDETFSKVNSFWQYYFTVIRDRLGLVCSAVGVLSDLEGSLPVYLRERMYVSAVMTSLRCQIHDIEPLGSVTSLFGVMF